jgi:predicted nucleic acid-binding protein
MVGSTPNPQSLVIDASIAVWAVLPIVQGKDADAAGRFAEWEEKGYALLAPSWWAAECTTAIRRALFNDLISETRAHDAIADLFSLEVQLVPIDADLCTSALDWAGRLQQSKAYDAFYLALAHNLSADLWTADKRLATAAQQIGLHWVHWVGDSR